MPSRAGATKPLCSRSICQVEAEPTPPHTTFHNQLTHFSLPIFDFLLPSCLFVLLQLFETNTVADSSTKTDAFATSFHQDRLNTFAYWLTVGFAAGALPSLPLKAIFPEPLTSVIIMWIKKQSSRPSKTHRLRLGQAATFGKNLLTLTHSESYLVHVVTVEPVPRVPIRTWTALDTFRRLYAHIVAETDTWDTLWFHRLRTTQTFKYQSEKNPPNISLNIGCLSI